MIINYFEQKLVGIYLSHLFNGEGNFGQPMSNIAVSQKSFPGETSTN